MNPGGGVHGGDPCQTFTLKRKSCHAIYGNRGEDCLHEELTEKRCLSLQFCPNEAKEYYGDTAFMLRTMMMTATERGESTEIIGGNSSPVLQIDGDGSTKQPLYLSEKGICASWAEHFAYNDELKYGQGVVNHHRTAQKIVNNDKKLKLECRAIAFQLAQCIRSKKLFPR